jgi:hypothetical protein
MPAPKWHGTSAPADDANVAKRLHLVAQLKLRYGWAAARIQQELAKQPDVQNPRTQAPWSLATIKRDLVLLEQQWRAEAARDFAAHKAQQLASLREARGAAWSLQDLGNVLRALGMEGALLGLDAPPAGATALADAVRDVGLGLSGLLHYANHAASDAPPLSSGS